MPNFITHSSKFHVDSNIKSNYGNTTIIVQQNALK